MGQFIFKLPDVGEGTASAEIAKWHVNVGDKITEDQNLVDLTTDKATVEIPSPVTGIVKTLHGAPGDVIAVGSELAVFETEGTSDGATAPAHEPVKAKQPEKPIQEKPAAKAAKALAAPAVRQRAKQLGVDLNSINGSGPDGRVTHADLDAGLGARPQRPSVPLGVKRDGVEEIKIIGIRRKTAERMQEAKRHIPHYSYVEEVDVTALEDLRATLKEQRGDVKLSVLPFLMIAVARAVTAFPQINAHFDDATGTLHQHQAVHLGIAVNTPKGLMVPVVTHAEARDLWNCAAEAARIAEAARNGTAARNELSGSTITITSLGKLGGITTTPIINRPEVAIIGVNKIVERPMVHGGQVAVRKMMNLSSSFDHRIIDGYVAAEFVQRLKNYLEQPATLFIP